MEKGGEQLLTFFFFVVFSAAVFWNTFHPVRPNQERKKLGEKKRSFFFFTEVWQEDKSKKPNPSQGYAAATQSGFFLSFFLLFAHLVSSSVWK